jgi:catechol 2,3-dioxygenase-like lactoylglutathione lyase family enzyme
MRIRRVVPDLHTQNLAASREFYETVLGFDLGMRKNAGRW